MIILSNTCVGAGIYKILDREYKSPLMSSLIVDDSEYIKFCNNIEEYVYGYDPILVDPSHNSIFALQSGSKRYCCGDLNYPVVKLHTLEVHFIHEKSHDHCLNRFNHRLNRLRDGLKQNGERFAFLSYSELLNDHADHQSIIDDFLLPNHGVNKVFLGPSKFKKNYGTNYIVNDAWNDVLLKRNSQYVYDINDQPKTISIFADYLQSIT